MTSAVTWAGGVLPSVIGSTPTVMVNSRSTVAPMPPSSVTTTMKTNIPAVVGVPLKSPVEPSDRPRGTILGPGFTENTYGAVPPLAVNVWAYGTVTFACSAAGGGVSMANTAAAFAGCATRTTGMARHNPISTRPSLPMATPVIGSLCSHERVRLGDQSAAWITC